MIKFLDDRISPVQYVLTPDNSLQQVSNIVDAAVDGSPLVTTALQSFNELGKYLLKAASDGDVQEVRTLISQGSPFTLDWLGTSPLHLAAQNNKIEVCEVLLKGGISKDARNKVDRTPLHLAAYEGHYDACEILIKYGADVNCQDMLNMTPLHWAVQNGHTAVVELLVRNNAEIDVKNKFDLTPQNIAVQINKLEIVELLQAYEGDSQAAAQTFMQLHTEGESKDAEETRDDSNDANSLSPVIIVDDNEFKNINNRLKRPQNFDAESVIINICDNATEEYRQDTKNKDPVIINLAKDINEEMPQISQKSNMLNGTSLSNYKIVDGVIQSSDEDADGNFSAIQLLQEHGITMLPNDNEEDGNILNAVMESGHSVVLTDVGKEVLNTVKQQEEKQVPAKTKARKIVTVTPEQFMSITNGQLMRNMAAPRTFKVIPVKPNVRRVVLKKNRPTPFGNMIKVQNVNKSKTELDNLMDELAEAKKTIEEYKSKLRKKELEVERYKIQLKILMDAR